MSAIVALVLIVLLAFVGLAVDGGHLYLSKTEMQNAADACALAASQELTGSPVIAPEAFGRAQAAGVAVATRNRQGLQNDLIQAHQVRLRFAAQPDGAAGWAAATEAAGDARFVQCDLAREGIVPWLMQLVGAGAQTIRAQATATLSPAQTTCGIPMAVCARGDAAQSPPFGLSPGQWISGRFSSGGGLTGSFNWVDYTPPMGGASEAGQLLRGAGQCSLEIVTPVGQPGNLGNAAARAWNTRFGLYQSGSDSVHTAAPDFSGYAYTATNWPLQANALADFMAKRRAHEPYGTTVAQGNGLTGLGLSNAYNPVITRVQHLQHGADRRLVVVPVVDCGDWGSSQTAWVRAWACMLMLHPVGNVNDTLNLEFVGLANAPASPCSSAGVPGSAAGAGPRVPSLVQ